MSPRCSGEARSSDQHHVIRPGRNVVGGASRLARRCGSGRLPLLAGLTEDIMRSTLVKLVLGCGLAAAFAAPTMACEFYKQTVKNDQAVAQSQQAPDPSQTSTTDTPQTAETQPAPNAGSN
jgi:hypothetical protein